MAVTQLIQFNAQSSVQEDTVQNAVSALQGVKAPNHFVIGTHVQDRGALQITAEWNDSQGHEVPQSNLDNACVLGSLRTSLGAPANIFHVPFNTGSTFARSGPATSKIVEYVQSWFPISRVNLDFQREVEQDFVKFNEIFLKADLDRRPGSLAYGWVEELQTHADIPGEQAKCFLITRGWEAMSDFEQSVQTEAYKEAIPILFAWKAPFKMVSLSCQCCVMPFDRFAMQWHVERKAPAGVVGRA